MAKDKPWWKRSPVPAPNGSTASPPVVDRAQDDDATSPDEDDDDDDALDALDADDVDADVDDPDADDDPQHADDRGDAGDARSATPAPAAAIAGDLADGASTTMAGSGAQPYVLRNVGGVYSCSCPAWRNQSAPPERRTCKHLRRLRGDAAETARTGAAAGSATAPARRPSTAAAPTTTTAPTATTPATAPPVLLAHAWDQVFDLSGWWMSEKLDGVRAYWDGARFISRLGNPFFAPAWFVAGLPSTPLDGELWAGRGKFQRAVSIARRQDASDAWRELTYVVFDAPALATPFEERLAFVRQHVERQRPPHTQWHPHERCRDLDHLRAELARVEALGGEGLMMRQPGSRYEVGRSWTLRKVKTFHDAEARVIAYVRGAGKHTGRLGSLQCEMPDGTVFHVGTGLSDTERAAPPPIGSIITYRYQELSNDGVPRFPSYVGVRHDVAWPPTGAPARPAAPASSAAPVMASPPSASPAASPAASADSSTIAPDRPSRSFARGDDRWTVELDGRTVRIRDQPAGGPDQSSNRRGATSAAAWRDAERLIADRLSHGYVEIM